MRQERWIRPAWALCVVAALGAGSLVLVAAAGDPLPAADDEPEMAADMLRMLGMMERMISFQKNWHEAVKDPERAIAFASGAVEELVDHDRDRQVEFLRGLLPECKAQGARNVIRFAIKDALKEAGKKAEALEEVRAIVKENAAAAP